MTECLAMLTHGLDILQVSAVAQSLLASAQLYPVFPTGSTQSTMKALNVLNASSPSAVLSVLQVAMATSGCSPSLTQTYSAIQQSMTAVAQVRIHDSCVSRTILVKAFGCQRELLQG